MPELYANNASTTLNGAINNSVTSLIVTSATGFPASGNFRIIIDTEIILVTAVAGTTFTIVRGQEGTAGASHSNGAAIDHIFTAGALDAIRGDITQQGALASLPTAGVAGRIYKPNDSVLEYFDNGSVWTPYFRGSKLVLPTGFSWINQGTASLTTTNGGEFVRKAGGGGADNIHARVVAVPATPFTRTLCHIPMVPCGPSSYPNCGMCLYDGTKFQTFAIQWRQDGAGADNFRGFFIGVTRWTNTTTFSADAFQKPVAYGTPIWQRIIDNGTTRSFAISLDGIEFTTLFADTHTTFLTASHIGFYVNAVACANDVGIRALSWE